MIRAVPDDLTSLGLARGRGVIEPTLRGRLRRFNLGRFGGAPRVSWTHVGLWLAAAGLLAAAAMSLAGQPYMAVSVALCSAGVGCGWAVTWAIVRQTVNRPLEQIATSLETLAARDVLALVDEFANLAEGEPARQIEVHATPVALPTDRHARRIAEALNSTISRLQGGVYQFYAASQEPCRRLFYVGPDDYLLGAGCAEAMARLVPNGGEILMMTPRFRHAGIELRRRGFESAIREMAPGMHVAGAVESRFDPARTSELVKSFIKTHPRLAGIYCTEAMGVLGCIEALTEMNLAGRIAVIVHDTIDGTMAAVRAGIISAAITQDPYGQGYDTAVHLFNALAFGWRPPESRLITVSDTVTLDNYRQYWQPYAGAVDSEASAGHRARPLGVSGRHLRIAILGLEDTPFWEPVRMGVLAAARELAPRNASVEWIVPEDRREFDVAVRGPAVDGLVRNGYDAIATLIYDTDLIPYLNRAADQGVLIATFNSEASSLQSLVTTLSKERRQLEIAAGDLETEARHDPLTGAYNRRLMTADLEGVRLSMATSEKPAAVVMIDLDHFKAYNDRYGHAAGDEVLRLVAQRIQAEIRPADRLYRYGGEEFLVLLRDTGLEEGETVATRIARGITTLGMPHLRNEPWGVVTVSAGVAAIDPSSPASGDCVGDADAALYRSKASGRNTVATFRAEPTPDLSEGMAS